MQQAFYIDVVLPLAIKQYYTYALPEHIPHTALAPGMRVVVQFGKGGKMYSALIRNIHTKKPEAYTPKAIDDVLDDKPIVTQAQFALWEWMSAYYLCTVGEVMLAALPAALRLASETQVVKNPSFTFTADSVSEQEFLILEALEIQPLLTLQEISQILSRKNIHPIIKKMVENGAILLEEEIKEKYKPKTEKFLALGEHIKTEEDLQNIFAALEKRAFKQLEVLMQFLQACAYFSGYVVPVKKSVFVAKHDVNPAVIEQLCKKNILQEYVLQTERIPYSNEQENALKKLEEAQGAAYLEIKKCISEGKQTVLLHGITSSGKTELYAHLIKETIEQGNQVLFLLPEIALTTQLINRLRKYFGNCVGVYHSRFTDNERVEIWNDMLREDGRFKIILGARSALFLPFSALGLIIVDEEHESSFKQQDPAPRYHARNTALMLAAQNNCFTLLGSATPSVETYTHALEGKYGLVNLHVRYGNILPPSITCCNIAEECRKKRMQGHFSPMLIKAVQKTIDAGEQVILFHNRRGYAPFLLCHTCGHVPQCKHCDVSLTYHKLKHKLVCHICGYAETMSQQCAACGNSHMELKGFGTEKIEEEMGIHFPNAKIARLDFDSTRAKHAYQRIISDFENHLVDILVGTQMVTKGLDFDHVGLVGVLNADNMMYFPDFRANERTFQLLLQVAGRAGRKQKQGQVIIQTYNPKHPIIQFVEKQAYDAFYTHEIKHRKDHGYPPYTRLIKFTLKHAKNQVLDAAAAQFTAELKKHFGNRVLGPEYPPVARVSNLYQKNILLKTEKNASTKFVRELIDKAHTIFYMGEYKGVRLAADVDPYF